MCGSVAEKRPRTDKGVKIPSYLSSSASVMMSSLLRLARVESFSMCLMSAGSGTATVLIIFV